MQVIIKVTDNRIRVQAPFAYKDALKTLEGSRWQPKSDDGAGAWTFPATTAAAQSVKQLFENTPKVQILADAEFKKLLQRVEKKKLAQDKKSAAELSDIPLSKTTAWLHQKQAFWFAYDLDAVLLFMGMGTGKTKVVCDLIVNRNHQATLVLCPQKVIPTWREEMQTHGGRSVHVELLREGAGTVQHKVSQARFALAVCKAAKLQCVVVINYESAYRSPFGPTYEMRETINKAGKKVAYQTMKEKGFALSAGFDCVVMDEIHKIKRPSGVQSRFCAHFANAIPHRIGLSGTIMAHGPLDVYAQCRALDPGVFGTNFAKFRERYAIMGGYENREIISYINQEEFADKLASITYQVSSDVLDLPPARHQTVYAQFEPEARRKYASMESAMYTEVEDTEIVADNILVKLLKLQELTSGYIRDEDKKLYHISKVKQNLLREVLEDFETTLAIVVYCRFTADLDIIKEICKEQQRTFGELSGRKDDLQAFKDGLCDVLAVQIQAGGAGVNLTRSNVGIYYSTGYASLDYEQSLKRQDRPGQAESVLFIHLVVENTVDIDIYESFANKESTINFVKQRIKQRQTA